MEFVGAKAALFCEGRVLTCLRDDRPGLPWAGHWDLPGGWLGRDEVASIVFGDEGQGWDMMPVEGFLGHATAVPEMQRRGGTVWQDWGALRQA